MTEAAAVHATLQATLDEYERANRIGRTAEKAQMNTIAGLLRGGATLLGKPIDVVWPDGPPFGKSNTELADYIEASYMPNERQ